MTTLSHKIDKPIIFLDIDGVLNHAGCENETDFIQESIDVINQVYKNFDVQIVLSTSWRTAFPFISLMNFFNEKGILAPVIDKTTEYVYPKDRFKDTPMSLSEIEFMESLNPEEGRNKEILSYIHIHEIKQYVILDDLPFTHPELKKHHVMPSFYDTVNGGLRRSHYAEIIEKLSL